MLHPHTEMHFVSDEVGHGIFASQDIPVGTIMWAMDPLDRIVTQEEAKKLDENIFETFIKYTYIDRNGDYVFCWDLNRYVNHSFEPNSTLTSLGFEIAIKDIRKGDEITNDYGTLNTQESFRCASGSYKNRDLVRADDLLHFHKEWDEQILKATPYLFKVDQPLMKFLDKKLIERLKRIQNGEEPFPSILDNYYRR